MEWQSGPTQIATLGISKKALTDSSAISFTWRMTRYARSPVGRGRDGLPRKLSRHRDQRPATISTQLQRDHQGSLPSAAMIRSHSIRSPLERVTEGDSKSCSVTGAPNINFTPRASARSYIMICRSDLCKSQNWLSYFASISSPYPSRFPITSPSLYR